MAEPGAACQVAGVILAAGLARRFGSEKILAHWQGRPLVHWVVDAALASRLAPVVLVTREELMAEPYLDQPDLHLAVNPHPEQGQAGSLKIGLQVVQDKCSHALFLLADQPLITPTLINRYVDLAISGAELAALGPGPDFSPPAMFHRSYFDELMQLSGDQGGRKVMLANRAKVRVVEPETGGQGADVDTPQDLAGLSVEPHSDETQ